MEIFTSKINMKDFFPEFLAHEKVTHVFNRGKICPLELPMFPREIVCPMCGEESGFRIVDGDSIIWSCKKDECISVNAGTGKEKIPYRQPLPTLKLCGVPEDFDDVKFSDIDQSKIILDDLKKFCESYRGFLLLAGSSGSGKTFASCAVMQKYLQTKNDCRFVNVADLFVMWLDLKQSQQSDLNLLEKYSSCELLVLDDLGTRTPSEAFLDFIYLLINNRINKSNCGTIISTNMSSKEMGLKLGSAIVSRISSGLIVKFSTEDRRIQKF